MHSRQLEFIPVSKIKPHPNNAKKHPKKQIRKLKKSIDNYGFTRPILVDERNVIIAGHGAFEAATAADLKEVPCLRLVGFSEAKKRAYRLADNKLAEDSSWDEEILSQELQTLLEVDLDFDITATGFEPAEIDLIIGDANPKKEHDASEENLETLGGPLVTSPGDLWILGDHKIFCGDALDSVSYDALLPTERACAVFADPPYNLQVEGLVSGKGAVKHKEFAMASGEMTPSAFRHFLERACSRLVSYTTDGSIHFICMDWRHCGDLQQAAQTAYAELKNICIWNKNNSGMGSLYRSKHEFIFVFKNGTAPHINNIALGKYGRNRSNIWNYAGANSFGADRLSDLAAHPTVKPVAMIADALLDVTCRRDVILDPFSGYGSTLIAAERTKRKARLIEIEPIYVDRTIRRWQRFAKDDAIHAVTGESFDTKALRLQSEPE